MNTVEIVCRSCKTKLSKKRSSFLKYYNQQITITCDNCGKRIDLLVDKEFIGNEKNFDAERTQFVDGSATKIWATDRLARLYWKDSKTGFELKLGENAIGRNPQKENCHNIVIGDAFKSISREHLMINVLKVDGKYCYTIKDNKSSNGTFLNNERLHYLDQVYLKQDDEVRLGSFRILIW